MSGPKCAHYELTAEAMEAAYRRHEEDRRRREERIKRLELATQRCNDLERQVRRFEESVNELRARFPKERIDLELPSLVRPSADELQLLEAHVGTLERALRNAPDALTRAEGQAQSNQEFRQSARAAVDWAIGQANTAETVIASFLKTKQLAAAFEVSSKRGETVQRILSRLSDRDWHAIPPSIEKLATEAVSADSEHRMEALCTELRWAVQNLNAQRVEQEQQKDRARALLAELDRATPLGEDRLKQELELIAAGVSPLTQQLAVQVRAAITSAEENRQATIQAMAGDIVQAVFKDLGYEVAPIENTLFTRGGATFFKKTGWGNYYLRLAVRPDEQTMNFNVVRIESSTNNADDTSRTSDIEIESDWCGEFPRVMDTLRARGVDMKLVHHLPVGAVPVPTVPKDVVPPSLIREGTARTRGGVSTKARPSGRG